MDTLLFSHRGKEQPALGPVTLQNSCAQMSQTRGAKDLPVKYEEIYDG